MNVKSFTFNPFQENTYIVYDKSKECLIIDPGCYTDAERKELKAFIEEKELTPVKLINTHCHIDHVLGNKFASEHWDLELYMHKEDLPLLKNAGNIGKMYGLEDYEGSPYPKHFLAQGDTLTFGENSFEILFTPGHAPGHICLYSKENNLLIAGDVIFQRSIGRTDLPGGDHSTLINSIITQLFPLPNETQVFCGHGPSTNLGYEKEHNPFLQ
jgi:glyoxylase-like metal-dependent hydrolase (beta-lactamase superfamily II)